MQQDLFYIGAAMTSGHVAWLEGTLDRFNADLPPLKEFILPGGGRVASMCQFARTVCRRAERRWVALQRSQTGFGTESLCYLNRLSDLLFVLARTLSLKEMVRGTNH